MNVVIEGPLVGQGDVCAQILGDLPDWFGVPSAVTSYSEDAELLPTFVARVDGVAVGLLTLKLHFEQAAEIVVMAVLPAFHRHGIGRTLMTTLESHLRGLGVEFVQVKTLDESAESRVYESTRRFYVAMGFVPLEVWPTVWSPGNPCLQMIKLVS